MADTNTTSSDEEGSMMERIKESPRTVSALIIILIVAAAIYAFSGNPQNQDNNDGQTDQAAVSTGEADDENTTDGSPTATPAAGQQPTVAPAVPATPLPEARRTEAAFVEVAQPGEGITHLARRATNRWLSENQAGYNVTKEHRIYIEDYIQNKVGTKGLAIGEEQTIPFELVKEAVEAARTLNEQQLKNLSQYTYVLT